jgi:glucose/mannose-6-phosphate isomerase
MMDNIDKERMIDVLRSFPNMIKQASELGDDVTFPREFVQDIAVLGMGGSGFTGDLLKTYLEDTPIHINVVKDYTLPSFIDRKSVVFAISYSGNTEETISGYRAAVRRNCKLVSISSGGKLQELAKMHNKPHIIIPKGIQPRLSVPFLFVPLLNVLSYSGIIDVQEKKIEKLSANLKNSTDKIESKAKELAGKLKGRIPLIYSSQRMFAVAEKWKTDINENAKTHAFYNVFPEFNHNEICGYENPRLDSHTVIISDKGDHERIRKRIQIFKKMIKSPTTEIALAGDEFLTRLISGVLMGMYVSYYLALEYNINPTPVKTIEVLKKELA